jgi:hypothetical protein
VADQEQTPRTRADRSPLTTAERRRVVVAAVLPIALGAVVLTPFAVLGAATAGEVVVAALVYGGLLGLTAAFVTYDRMQARQCPRCASRSDRGATVCSDCGYDLVEAPRYACAERHAVYLEDGLCDCGRRLQRLPTARGIGPEVVWVLKAGAWLLAFLVLVGLILQWTSR